MSKEKSGVGKLLAGIGIGACLGILFAPKSGKESRKELKEKMDDLLEKAKNIDAEEVKNCIMQKLTEIKDDLKKLDKETVADTVKTQAKKIKNKADDLVDYAKEKGTPLIENAAKEVKRKTVEVLEGATSKLKEEPKKKNTKKSAKGK